MNVSMIVPREGGHMSLHVFWLAPKDHPNVHVASNLTLC